MVHQAAPIKAPSSTAKGARTTQTFLDGPGGTGNLTGIPLNNSISHSRDSAFDISARASRLLFDARTPTAWGEIKAYVEMDFATNVDNNVQTNVEGVASSYTPRLRKAYATFDGLEAGQDTGIMHDPDADAELVDQGGGATAAGRAREAQVRYTYPGPYGTVFTFGGENPVPRLNGPFGQVDIDTSQIGNTAACSVTGNVVANLPSTTACLGSLAQFSPLQVGMPEWIGTARINQPWGHMQFGATVREDKLNDGQYLDQEFIGAGVTLSGDVHPFSGNPGPLGRDDLGFGARRRPGHRRPDGQRYGGGDEFRGADSGPGCRLGQPAQRQQPRWPRPPPRRGTPAPPPSRCRPRVRQRGQRQVGL